MSCERLGNMDTSGPYTVADISLADAGEKRVAWARSRMPALAALKAQAEIDKPLHKVKNDYLKTMKKKKSQLRRKYISLRNVL